VGYNDDRNELLDRFSSLQVKIWKHKLHIRKFVQFRRILSDYSKILRGKHI